MKKEKLKLNLGGGFVRYPGFKNVDFRKETKPEYYADLEKKNSLKAIKTNSVEKIVLSHVLEHIKNIEYLMAEIYRVCINGAEIRIAVPYWNHQTAIEDPTHVRFFTENSMMYFSKKTTGSDGRKISIPYNFVQTNIVLCPAPKFTKLDFNTLLVKAKERFNVIEQVIFTLKVIK